MDIIDTPLPPFDVFLRSSKYSVSVDGKSNSIFDLNSPIYAYSNIDILVGLESFQFTNAFYNIYEYNSCFYDETSGYPTVTNKTVPIGNYDIDSLMTTSNSSMTGFHVIYHETTYRVSLDYTTDFELMSGVNSIYEVLGFDDDGTTEYDTNITAPYLFNMMSVQVLHICVPNISINSIGLKSTPKYNILASIQVTSEFGQVQNIHNVNNCCYKITDNTIPFINILILDQDLNQVNYNNIDWFMNISFKFQYHKELIQLRCNNTNIICMNNQTPDKLCKKRKISEHISKH